jgi:fibronectin-binding autotransporter adhesin
MQMRTATIYYAALYGGAKFDNWALRAGAAYTWQQIDMSRGVFFPGFSELLDSDYSADTAQVFGEVGYGMALGGASLEPFAGVAYVNLETDGFAERSGHAALDALGTSDSVGFTTLGVRDSTNFQVGAMALTARGTLAWRYAFGDTDPVARVAFNQGLPFGVAGLPVAENAAVVEVGLDANINEDVKLGVSYSGQIASDVQDHGFQGRLVWRF